MNDNQEISHKNPDQKPNRPGMPKWQWVVIIVLLLGSPATVWWWQQQNVNSLDSKIKNLDSQVTTLTTKEQTQPTVNEPVVTKYSAQVGKFNLALGDYAIVVLHDGGAEGGAITKLLVAEKTSIPSVVKSDLYSNAELTAVQHGLTNTTFAKAVSTRLEGASATKLPSLTVDGVTAEAYRVDGLDYSKKVFFAKGEILYEIDLASINEKTDKMLDAIVKGFTFN